jgi:hypothetical protein
MIHPQIPVWGRLKQFYPKWLEITEDQWVLDIIKEGYKLEFVEIPKFNGELETRVPPKQLDIILQEVDTLIRKYAIEEIPPDQV